MQRLILHFVFCLLTAVCFFKMPLHGGDELLKAHEYYLKGEKAQTLAERQAAFNNALSEYTKLESTFHPEYGNGKLYYNIGNTYFQLEEYPWAVFYYYKALSLRPNDELVQSNLKAALSKLGLQYPENKSIFLRLFLFRYLPLPTKLQLLALFSVLLFVCFIGYSWYPVKRIKIISEVILILWIVALVSVGYSRYFSPVEGVIMQPAQLYRDAGEQYAKALEKPILPGEKVRVLESVQEGLWLKIITPDGHVGYIPSGTIKLVNSTQ